MSRQDSECAARHAYSHSESAPGLPLTFKAVAYSHCDWITRDSVPDVTALASAFAFSLRIHTRPFYERSNVRGQARWA